MTKKDSVVGGGSVVGIARFLGMLMSFLLFLVLARHSTESAGVFRTILSYLIAAEFLGILGMFRWLSVEVAQENVDKWRLFYAVSMVMTVVGFVLMIIYGSVAHMGLYSEQIADGLLLATMSLVPSSVYQCTQAVLVGIGKTKLVGFVNAFEYLLRCSVSIFIILIGLPVVWVIVTFVVARWIVALYSFIKVRQLLNGGTWQIDLSTMKHVLAQSPKFIVIIVAFLMLRNSAMMMIPSIHSEVEAALYAVAYQLFDLILVIPSVLAITSNHVFITKAGRSNSALRGVTLQMLGVFAMVMFPCIAITAGFSTNFLLFLYGDEYTSASYALVLLMLASGFAMIDMVLSQVMNSRQNYQADMYAVLIGGGATAALTYLLTKSVGVSGAAQALLFGMLLTVVARVIYLKVIFSAQLLLLSIWRPLLAATMLYVIILAGYHFGYLAHLQLEKYLWIAYVPLLLLLYVFFLWLLKGLKKHKLNKMKQFLY